MPHDCKGRKIDLGDVIIARPYNQGKGEPRDYVGVVVDMHSAEQSCTGQMSFQKKSEAIGNNSMKMDLDYFGAEDSTLVMKADGTLPPE